MSEKNNSHSPERRRFLGSTAVLAGVGVTSGISLVELAQAKPDDQAVNNSIRWGMLIDANKCGTDCSACVDACSEEQGWGVSQHGGSPEQDPGWIRKVHLRDKQTGKETSLPMLCQHCETAPCVDVCPTGASFKREDGIVLVDRHTCIGCRYCMMACPYNARSFVHEAITDQKPHMPRGKGCVESCTFCVHRIDKDQSPACVEACHKDGHQAMTFGDLNNPESPIAKQLKSQSSTQIRSDLRLNQGVRYQGV
jgi:tetrathionate reductase subunit B